MLAAKRKAEQAKEDQADRPIKHTLIDEVSEKYRIDKANPDQIEKDYMITEEAQITKDDRITKEAEIKQAEEMRLAWDLRERGGKDINTTRQHDANQIVEDNSADEDRI